MPITCPNGHENDSSNRFCDQCGAPLSQPVAAAAATTVATAPTDQAAPASPNAGASTACPQCGQENLPGTAFCENCGAQLPPPTPVQADGALASQPASEEGAAGKACLNCGYQNAPDDRFCDQCGYELEVGPQVPVTTTSDQGAGAGAAPTADSLAGAMDQAQPLPEGEPRTAPATASAQPGQESLVTAMDTLVGDQQPVDATASAPDNTSTSTGAGVGDATASAGDQTGMPEQAQATVATTAVAPPQQAAAAPQQTAAAPQQTASTQTCSNCGASLPPNAKFCLECGTRVQQLAMVRPTNCVNCGSELLPNAKFCMECGTPVEMVPATGGAAAAQTPSAPAPQPAATTSTAASASAPAPQQPPTPPLAEATSAPASAPPPQQATNTPSAVPMPVPPSPAPSVASPPSSTPASAAPVARSYPAPDLGSGPRLVASDGTVIPLAQQGELIVGREDPISGVHPDIDLTNVGGEAGGVSRRHAMIQAQGGQWSIVDLDSTNYTRINGNRIAPHTPTPLQDGARVHFGRLELEFKL